MEFLIRGLPVWECANYLVTTETEHSGYIGLTLVPTLEILYSLQHKGTSFDSVAAKDSIVQKNLEEGLGD